MTTQPATTKTILPTPGLTGALLLALLGLLACGARAETMPRVFKKLVRPTSQDNPRNGEGDLIELKDGSLLLAYTRWTKGDGADDAPADIRATTSRDGGLTWSDDVILQPNDAMNVMSVSLLRLADGEILFAFGRRYSNARNLFYSRFSTDEGRTWSREHLITPLTRYQGMNNDHVIQLKSGRLLAPFFLCRGHSWKEDFYFHATVTYSDDNGRLWQTYGQMLDVPGSPAGADEPGLVQLKDGRVLMIIRTGRGKIYRSFSSDGGLRWTSPEPTDLASPPSPASIARIPSTGDLLLIWNNSTRQRTPLTCALSQDEGKTWRHIKNLEDDPKGRFCYTSITFVKDRVLLTYYGLGGLVFASIDVRWFYE
jgi:sialidase-1